MAPTNQALRRDASRRSHQPSVAAHRHDQWIESRGQTSERTAIEMVVVVVAQQHDRDFRKIVEAHRRLTHAPRAEDAERSRVLRVDGIGQDVAGRRLNQARRVADERADGSRAAERRRHRQSHLDRARPPGTLRALFGQHARYLGERLLNGRRRIEVSSTVEMIAHASCDSTDAVSAIARSRRHR